MAYVRGRRLVLGHSIVELVQRLAAAVPELGKLREQAGLLDQYYVATRYPDGLPGGSPSRPSASARPGRLSRRRGRSWRWRGDEPARWTRRAGNDRI